MTEHLSDYVVERTMYRVVRGIQSDRLNRKHAAGEVVDLSEWPPEIVDRWVERGDVEPVPPLGGVVPPKTPAGRGKIAARRGKRPHG